MCVHACCTEPALYTSWYLCGCFMIPSNSVRLIEYAITTWWQRCLNPPRALDEGITSHLRKTNSAEPKTANHEGTKWPPFKYLPQTALTSADQRNGPSGSDDLNALGMRLVWPKKKNRSKSTRWFIRWETRPTSLSDDDRKTVLDKFQGYFVKRKTVIFERARFNRQKQEVGEGKL